MCRRRSSFATLRPSAVDHRCSGLLSAVGLGSVSDHCVHALHCPTIVVKDGDSGADAAHADAKEGGGGAVCGGTSVSGTKA
jgi:hypothetical protein